MSNLAHNNNNTICRLVCYMIIITIDTEIKVYRIHNLLAKKQLTVYTNFMIWPNGKLFTYKKDY